MALYPYKLVFSSFETEEKLKFVKITNPTVCQGLQN